MVDSSISWGPTASIDNLRSRALILQKIRAFFAERDVLEVETPLLSSSASTDPFLDSFVTCYQGPGAAQGRSYYLQTSPEFAMKRLLAAGSGPIYQICKSFRNGESGDYHNPEFTMLEWYRPGYNHHDLMDEVEALICALLGCGGAERLTYRTLFMTHLGLDPHTATPELLSRCAASRGLVVEGHDEEDRDTWLALLLTHCIEPNLGAEKPLFIYDYPASQAMLARLRGGDPAVAERFELYVRGMELANGFHELCDAAEQRLRFESNLSTRRALGLTEVPMDGALLAALDAGMPACAGVALGIDRLVMLVTGSERLGQVMSFPIDRA